MKLQSQKTMPLLSDCNLALQEKLVILPEYIHNKIQQFDLTVYRTSTQSSRYQDILSIRSAVYGGSTQSNQLPDDDYSELYCAYYNKKPVASIRATRAAMGLIDCERFYPQELLNKYRSCVVSATRFCSKADASINVNIGMLLTKITWFDQLDLGSRLDIINVKESMINYYKRLGYIVVSGSYFIHPVWDTPSYVMVLAADSTGNSAFKKIFSSIDRPLNLSEIKKYTKLCSHETNRLAKGAICPCNKLENSHLDCNSFTTEN